MRTFAFKYKPVKGKEKEITAVAIEGEVWFIADELGEVLEAPNLTASIRELNDTDKQLIDIGGKSRQIISENGLQSLLDGNKANQGFQDWTKNEVIPATRKNSLSFGAALKKISKAPKPK